MWRHLILSIQASWALTACDMNLFESAVKPKTDAALMEEARIKIDDQDYEGALSTLRKVDRDTNDVHLLRSAARMGVAGMNLWDTLIEIADSSSLLNRTGRGVDNFFEQIRGTVLGEGDIRTLRLIAISDSIRDLLDSPDSSANRVKNLACVLAGIMTLPTVADAAFALQDTRDALAVLGSTVDVSNPNAQCTDLSNLNASLGAIENAQIRFRLIMEATVNCQLLDPAKAEGELNKVEAQIAKFKQNADAGCSSTPACGSEAACQALSLECVKDALNVDSELSIPQDGRLTQCELVQNCLNTDTCF